MLIAILTIVYFLASFTLVYLILTRKRLRVRVEANKLATDLKKVGQVAFPFVVVSRKRYNRMRAYQRDERGRFASENINSQTRNKKEVRDVEYDERTNSWTWKI